MPYSTDLCKGDMGGTTEKRLMELAVEEFISKAQNQSVTT